MSSKWQRLGRLGLVLLLSVGSYGCGEEDVYTNAVSATGAGRVAPPGKADAKSAKPVASAAEAPKLPTVAFSDGDFVESEDSRDPFRDFEYLFVKRDDDPQRAQRRVKAPQYALDELKLQAIISSRIMLTDPTGLGWIVYNGDYVGKPELVSSGGTDGTEVAINWRVDRIRATDVVFIREDASHPEIPPTTRVVPLYPAGEGT